MEAYMKQLIFSIMICSSLSLSQPIVVDSDHDLLVHATAHFGASFALTTIFYGIYTRGFKMPPLTAFLFSALLTTSIGLSYKFMEGTGPVTGLGPAILYNTAGILATGLTIKLFDF